MSSDSHLAFLLRMFILSMVTFGGYKDPSVSFKLFDDFNDLIRFHVYTLCWRKGNKKNTILQIKASEKYSF